MTESKKRINWKWLFINVCKIGTVGILLAGVYDEAGIFTAVLFAWICISIQVVADQLFHLKDIMKEMWSRQQMQAMTKPLDSLTKGLADMFANIPPTKKEEKKEEKDEPVPDNNSALSE